jgi:nucleotide-binding universal stress UspA family protein
MKVLIGVDGSQSSLDAVRMAGRLVNPATDRVALYFSPLELEKRVFGQSRRVVEGAAAALFEEASGLLPKGFAAEPEMICSSKLAAVGILEASSGWHADMVVVGARGHGSIERLLLGSVSRAVVHGAQLPVLVVRTPAPDDHPLKVLVCHHPASAKALAGTIGRLHWPAGTDGHIIGVTESMLAGPLPKWLETRVRDPDTAAVAEAWMKEHDDEVKALGTAVAAFQKTLPGVFGGHTAIVAEGNPGERILDEAKKGGIDLIVTGRTPTDALSRWLLGSTSEAVLTHALASVLVVPVEKS